MFFERFIFLEEVMPKYTKKEKLEDYFASGKNAIDEDTDNTVFSYIPNTAETSFYG
jgi:hypothetical protein